MMQSMRNAFLIAATVSIFAIVLQGGIASAEPVLIYSQDWSRGAGGWGGIGGFRPATRIFTGNPIAPFAYYFRGGCGMGLFASTIPSTRMKLVALVYMGGSNRNGFSVNVRTSGGTLIYKYSMGAGNHVDANCQPPTDHIRVTNIPYATNRPYELYSIWYPGTGRFSLGLKDVLTGRETQDGPFSCRSGAAPGAITFDQEGGHGPAILGKVEVWLGE